MGEERLSGEADFQKGCVFQIERAEKTTTNGYPPDNGSEFTVSAE